MISLQNTTPLSTACFFFLDRDGIERLTVAIKATFTIPKPGEPARLAEKQLPVIPTDQYFGDPKKTGVRYPADLVPAKPSTDIGLIGCAYSPGGKRVPRMVATIQVGPVRKMLLITGDRHWRKNLLFGFDYTEPKPFTTMPLCYEKAYGGEGCPSNPIGTGFLIDKKQVQGIKLPNIEDPEGRLIEPLQHSPVAGFGFIPPAWEGRQKYVGTRDEAYWRDQYPLPPMDLDPRHFNAAAPGLTAEGYLKGGEPVRLSNLSPKGDIEFALPRPSLNLTYRLFGSVHTAVPDLWTVILEPDEERFILVWGTSFETQGQPVEEFLLELDQDGSSVEGI